LVVSPPIATQDLIACRSTGVFARAAATRRTSDPKTAGYRLGRDVPAERRRPACRLALRRAVPRSSPVRRLPSVTDTLSPASGQDRFPPVELASGAAGTRPCHPNTSRRYA
jgi:hypothetical protein